MKIISYLKSTLILLGVIGSFFIGNLMSEKKRLEDELEEKEKEEKEDHETQKRIIKYDNASIDTKRSWLRSYREGKNK